MSTEDLSWLERPTAPDMGHLSRRELAEITGLAPKRIDALIRAGMPCTPGASARAGYSFDLKAIIKWFVDDQGADPLTLARQRKVEAETRRIERENRKAAGELISIPEARREIAEGMVALRAHLLAIPSRLTDQSEEVKAAVRGEIVAGINALSFEHGDPNAPAS